MNSPSQSAENLIIGLGIVLLLATAFALIDGRYHRRSAPPLRLISMMPAHLLRHWLVDSGYCGTLPHTWISSRMAHNSGKGPVSWIVFSPMNLSLKSPNVLVRITTMNMTRSFIRALGPKMEAKMLESNHSEEE
ncbi:MAG: hypothetical protein Ct9H90mP16_15500 [Candidatus Poseidoniales archaeon]|nr:MAG: hypothetical protein Ct9H90mP16_15500 [Candidatus Poseidoniales archaeon]